MTSNCSFSNLSLFLRSQPVALTCPLQQGAITAWCPLKITPTRRPVSTGFFGEGRQSENAQQIKKKIMKTKKNSDSDSGLLNRTAQLWGKNQLRRIDFRRRFYNRGLSTERVLKLLYHETPRLWELAEVVGRWIWIQFDDRQPPTVTASLAQLGFHWNQRRQTWQHPCGRFSPLGSHPTDPRCKYRSYFPADVSPS
jgi:hypothetical protein